MKKNLLAAVSLFIAIVAPLLMAGTASASFNKSLLIRDSIFDDKSTMSADRIDSFLNSFPNSCISSNNGFTAPEPTGYNPDDHYIFGGNVSAGRVIYAASQAYDINPQVLLATLQKEQSLVNGSAGCHPNIPNPPGTYKCDPYGNGHTIDCVDACHYGGGCTYIAVGYDCPYRCAKRSVGFSMQIIKAAWRLKFSQQRSLGNIDWAIIRGDWDNSDDQQSCYSGPMTEGNHQVCPSGSTVFYDGYKTIDGQSVYISTGATAALYSFTPHFHGNELFVSIFEDWFGSTTKPAYPEQALVGDWDGDGKDTVGLKRGAQYLLDNNNDGEEDVTFGIGRPTDVAMVGDWDGDGKDEIGIRRGNTYYFDTDNNGTANISFIFGRDTDKAFVGDWNDDGKDEIGIKRGYLYYFDTNNDGTADKRIAIGRATDSVIFGDWDGDGKDEIGLRRGNYYYYDTNDNGKADVSFGMGRVTDIVVIGDWDGDGKDSVGLKRGKYYYLDNNNDGTTDLYIGLGRTTDGFIVGDWDDDGVDEIGLKRYNHYYYDTNSDSSAEVSFIFGYY